MQKMNWQACKGTCGNSGKRDSPLMWPPHISCPTSLPASRMPWMSFPVTLSRCSYVPGLSRISRVLMPAVIARGLPDSVPAWYMGPASTSTLRQVNKQQSLCIGRQLNPKTMCKSWQSRCSMLSPPILSEPGTNQLWRLAVVLGNNSHYHEWSYRLGPPFA